MLSDACLSKVEVGINILPQTPHTLSSLLFKNVHDAQETEFICFGSLFSHMVQVSLDSGFSIVQKEHEIIWFLTLMAL